MDVIPVVDAAVSRIAAAIGEPARARMLYSLADGLVNDLGVTVSGPGDIARLG